MHNIAIAEDNVEQITIFGSNEAVNEVPGSAVYIDGVELADYAVTDIMRVLSTAPGVYFMEEDGYGLRPNIGMRGNSSDRSEKITVMEDGVLAAPAPYASPSAYYFPTVGRMSAIEILKGSSAVKYGPRSSGGVLNLVSTPLPKSDLEGKFDISAGTDQFRKLHSVVGGTGERVSGVFDIFHYAADGFKELPGGQNTGFEKTDLLSKFSVDLDAQGKHNLEIKLKYSDEVSDETYVGITDEDFLNNPFQRYSASQLDQMNTEHKHISLHYDFIINNNVDLSVIGYHNDFHRNWYKVSKVGGLSLGSGAEELASLLDSNSTEALQGAEFIEVGIKANNRDYLSQGVQAELGWLTGNHELSFGLRVHEDEMDRFQWVDTYSLNASQQMSLLEAGTPGTDSNRIDSANALSLFVHDQYTLGDLVISGGLRFEDITLERHDWGKTDPSRDATPAHRENDVSALLPSIGFTYQVWQDVMLLAGVQKAFAPPSPGNNNAQEEEGWNYEAGMRFDVNGWRGEAIGFYTRLDNLHGNCTASQGCSDDLIGQQYNAGKVTIAGAEFSIGKTFSYNGYEFPLNANYTYSNAEFDESFSSELDFWGDVTAGDELPYLPQQTAQVEVGVQQNNWHVKVAVKYTDDMRTSAGNETITSLNGIESRTIADVSANYSVADNQQIYAVIDNLFDKEYVATRRHGGIQVGKPRTIQIGYRYQF
ncbi:MAG: TonB-dependent receptor family protein [Aestuariibacter sp.]